MWVFPKAIVLTTKSHFNVKRIHVSIGGLVVRTIARISVVNKYAQSSRLQNQTVGTLVQCYSWHT